MRACEIGRVSNVSLLIAAAASLCLARGATAQPDCGTNDEYLPVTTVVPTPPAATSQVAIDSQGEYYWNSGFTSVGWGTMLKGFGCDEPFVSEISLLDDDPDGFRLGIHLMTSPSPGDYLPPSPTLGGSSLALLPPGSSGAPTAWRDIGRPTLHGQVDLVTGLPLIQTTDLELPFGGAHFRLNRTRSGRRSDNRLNTCVVSAMDEWWDWAGAGWMISENPILMIDAALADVTGDNPRTCWLILDAHHSIPFQQIESNGTYEAPPRFRARMSHNGTWAAGTRSWADEPTQYEISLFDGAVKYTFVVIREDVPDNEYNEDHFSGGSSIVPSSYHDRPYTPNQVNAAQGDPWEVPKADPKLNTINPGFGIPYYGLCVKIEDQHGHTVEINYCPTEQFLLDDASTLACTEWGQTTNRKGQINYVQLKSGGVVDWTLVYSHRRFLTDQHEQQLGALSWIALDYPAATAGNEQKHEMYSHTVLDRIYVFEGEPATVGDLDNARLSLPHTDTGYYEGGADPISGSSLDGLEDDWRYLVRYHYLETLQPPTINDGNPVPMLIRTSVASKQDSLAPPTSRSTVFVYNTDATVEPLWSSTQSVHSDVGEDNELPWLRLVFTDEDLARVLEDAPAHGLTGLTVDDIAHWRTPGGSPPLSDAQEHALRVHASVELEWPEGDSAVGAGWTDAESANRTKSSIMVASGDHGQYFTRSKDRLVGDVIPGVVSAAAIRDEDGVKRFYRISRVRHAPEDAIDTRQTSGAFFWPGQSPSGVPGPYSDTQPMRSNFAHPYQWHGYTPAAGVEYGLADNPMDLKDPLWIAVVDEFNSRDSMLSRGEYSGATYRGTSFAGTKRGQLSRRVVEISPTGYILKERRWEYGDDGISVYGGGLGEEFIYQKVDDYFTAGEIPPSIPPTTHGTPTDPIRGDQLDPWKSVRDELLLVERRSVGWSAADLVDRTGDPPPWTDPEPGPTAQANGLVHFYQYDVLAQSVVLPGPGNEPDFETVPANARVQLVAQGVKKGVGTTTLPSLELYTRQIFRNDNRPTEVLCEVEFTAPTDTLLSSSPSYTTQTPDLDYPGIRATHFVSDWDVSLVTATTEQPALSHMVVGPPRQARPGSSWYYPVEWESLDEDGNSKWSAVGQVIDPTNPSGSQGDQHASITLTYYKRDSKGRSEYTVVDAEPGTNVDTPDGETVGIPPIEDPPAVSDWVRIPDAGALNYVTAFKYDGNGLSDIFYPSGMRWARRVIKAFDPEANPPVEFAREFIFNNLDEVGVGEFVPRSPGEVRDYATVELTGSPRIKRRVEFLYADGTPFDFLDGISNDVQPDWQELWQLELAPDANGRLQDASLFEFDPTGAKLAVGSKEVNDLGEVHREREIDGSITRLTKDSVGQVLRTYVGTEDEKWPDYGAGIAGFNMILAERYEYGTGINDAWQPVSMRTYDSMPGWHASLGAHTFDASTGGTPVGYYDPAPADDAAGAATITGYDWRMRPVRVDSYEKGDPATATRLSTTLTWLDHADRPRLVVTFGKGDLSGAPDPTSVTPQQELDDTAIPGLAQLYSLTLKPTSITQMFYGPDGSMVERRTYDMEAPASSSPPYLAEFSYSAKGGRRVYSQQPGQPIQINTLDGVGRVSKSLTVLPGGESASGAEYELSRTDYKYDANGNAEDVKVWTRVADTGEALSASNAVRTRTVNWYDVEKRLVATAELGTEEDTFSPTGSEWPYDDDAPAAIFTGGDITGVNRWTLPTDVPLWVYVYDKQGNQTHMVDPDGRVTEFEYSGSGRMVKKIENAAASNPNLIRTTEYEHQYGRVTKMATRDTNVAGVGQDQWTEVTYEADIVDDDFNVMSSSKALVGALSMEGGPTDPIIPNSYVLRYTFQGQIAEREDQRGVVFRYDYDDLGRLVSIDVGHRDTSGDFVAGYPASMTPSSGDPLDRIERVEYEYDDAGNLELVTNKGLDEFGVLQLVSQNEYDYDARGSLLTEWQAIGAAVSASTPHIAYTWEYEATDISTASPGGTPPQVGHLRLTEMEYPQVPSSPVRRITMDYGLAGGDGDVLSRLEKMTSNLGEPTIAEFAYFGASRRKSLTLGGSSAGGGVVQSLDTDSAIVGLEGLDRFGRVADLHFENGASTPETMYRGEYTYDMLGNRVTAQLTQAPVGAVSQDNIFSQLNSYDELNRLIQTEYGTLVGLPSAPAISPNVRTDTWSLDLLGNWVGGAAAGTTGPPTPPVEGRLTTGDLDWYAYSPPRGVALGGVTPDAGVDQFSMLQAVNERNEIFDLQVEDVDATGLSPVPTQYDAAGNLEFDGDYYYQYDAWNRLIQVNEATWVSDQVVIGDIVKHYTYDGHGRLIRIQSPYPQPGSIPDDDFRTERLYYDGIRRIQEVVVDPILGNSNSGSQSQNEQNQVGGGTATPYLAREYVWGPGDNGFDELLVQYDGTGDEWWAIMDAGGDLVALCDFDGTGSTARVVGQWTYDAYGAVLSADHLHAMALPHLGHKGLFLDRLDVGIVTGSGGAESPRLVPYAHTLYHNRNRVYAPALGRFMQRDPNATAQALLSMSSTGRGFAAVSLAFSMEDLNGDGMNLYQYLGSNPWSRSDPLGLSWDPFSIVDDYLAESAGSGAALLSALGQNAKAAAIVAATIASYLPFPAAGNLGELALYALGESSDGQLAMGLALGVVPGGKLAHLFAKSGLGKFIGKLGASAWKSAKHYASMAGSALGRAVGGLTDRARQFLRRGCGCFESGTEVWTLRGLVPIEEVTTDDYVFAQDETTGECTLRRVLQTFVRQGAPIVAVTITTAAGAQETLRTTEEHPFWVPTEGWVEAGNLIPGDAVEVPGGGATVELVRFTPVLEAVYNFEVEGVHTYFVGANGVLVHNRSVRCFSLLDVRQLPADKIKKRPKNRGDAPFGDDGKAIQIHHVDQNPSGPFIEITKTDHARIAHPLDGLTREERRDFNSARRAYWARQWDLGRFKDLPE